MASLHLILCLVCFIFVSDASNMPRPPDDPKYCNNNPNPCLNGGLCVDYLLSYVCKCPSRCFGHHCQNCERERNDECSPNPCKGDCQCHKSCQHSGGYYCRSNTGFLGKNCTIPVPSLRCEADSIIISVSERFVQEYDLGLRNSYIKVTPQMDSSQFCKVTRPINGMHELRIPLPFTSCGTISTKASDGTMVFTNQMWFNRILANTMFDVPLPVIEFQCRYDREYRIVTKLRPVVPTPLTLTRQMVIQPGISLCKVASCPARCPTEFAVSGGSVYTVGEMIHVHMHLDSGSYVTGLENMHLSCSSSPSANIVEIVTNGCGTSAGLPCVVSHSASSHTVCVSFQTPRGLSCNEIYIHAKLSSCDRAVVTTCQDNTSVRRCPPNRKRRSVSPDSLTIGPILIFEGSKGRGQLYIHGMEDEDTPQLLTAEIFNSSKVLVVSNDALKGPAPVASNPATPEINGRRTPVIVLTIFAAILFLASVISVIVCFRSRTMHLSKF